MSNFNTALAFNEFGGQAANLPPQFNSVGTITAIIGTTVSLGADINITDDGAIASLQWTQIGGNDVTINNPGVKNANIDTTGLTEGTRTFRLTATDDEGARAYIERTVILALPADVTPPDIQLIGDNPLRVPYGQTFEDPGALLTDNRDEDRIVYGITAVEPSGPGEYTFTYSGQDAAGNASASITRLVIYEEISPSEMLEILASVSFYTMVSDNNITAYIGRANREVVMFKPSDTTNIACDAEGHMYLDERNQIERIEVSAGLRTENVTIDSLSSSILIGKGEDAVKARPRLGDLNLNKAGSSFDLTVTAYVFGYEMGVVLSSPKTPGSAKITAYNL